jgi:thiol-disulfide isomerase/thioredoxin
MLGQNTPAPDFSGGTNWLNTPTPLTMAGLRGKVVLVDFWTYTCINCIRTLPHLTAWYEKYKNMGLVIVGVHTPEFEFEKDTANVARAMAGFQITYPVVQDNNYAIWNAYQNQYWPADYLIDSSGHIRRTDFGEGNYDQTEAAIQTLLAEAGQTVNLPLDQKPDLAPKEPISPESYLGANRSQYFYPNSVLTAGTADFTLSDNLPADSFSFGGTWDITAESAIAGAKAVLNYHFLAAKVYLVLSPPANSKSLVNVYIDGKLSTQLTIDSDRLYTLFDVNGPPEDHVIKLEFLTPGTEAFAFTFG